MAQQELEEEQVKFHDVAICFSEDDWKTLHEWQKDFYKHVMKEIHQALISMGYQIVNVDTLLRIYKGKDVLAQDSEDADRINIEDPIVSSVEPVEPDILFRIKNQQDSNCKDQHSSKKTMIQSKSSSGVPIVPAAFSVKTEEVEVYSTDIPESEALENCHSLPTEFPLRHTVVGLTNELEPEGSLMGYPDAGRASSSSSSTGPLAIPEDVLLKIKDEPVYFTDNPEYEIFDAPTDDRRMTRMTRQRNAGQSVQYAMPTSLNKASSKQRNTNFLQRARKGPFSVRQLRSDIYQEKRGDKMTACESDLITSDRISMHQGRARIRIPQKDNEYETNLRNSLFRKSLSHAQQSQSSYRCNEFEHNSPLKRELIRHMETHLGVKPFACTECDKIFFNKANLTKHYRTHSGEKPFMCTFCHKSFSRKDHLTRHIRIHTGERPYKCTECERSFPWISDLNHHRRNRH